MSGRGKGEEGDVDVNTVLKECTWHCQHAPLGMVGVAGGGGGGGLSCISGAFMVKAAVRQLAVFPTIVVVCCGF